MVLFEPQIRELERKLTEELQRREAAEIAQEIAAGVDAYYDANPDMKRDLSADLAICERWDIGNPNLDNEFFRFARTGWPIAIRRALDAEDRCHTLEAEVSAAWLEIVERDAEIAELKAANERLRSAGLALIKRLEALSGTVDEPKNIRPIDLLDEYSTLRRVLIIYGREESEG